MHFTHLSSLLVSFLSLNNVVVKASPFTNPQISGLTNTPNTTLLARRGEPTTGDDFPDTSPHPNELDQVETAFKDAIELTSYVLQFIDTDDSEVFPHYFSKNDRDEVKRIFQTINNNDKGSDKLGDILIQKKDDRNLCPNGRTLAYMEDGNTNNPYIVLCPNAFKKKAVTPLKGADPQGSDRAQHYALCKQDGGAIDQHVSWVMNTLGMTLLHEYLHYDGMINSKFGSIVDDPSGKPGYGPVNVYDKLPKQFARVNADSYAYYASQVLWSVLCGHHFDAPRGGIDDVDPDCGGQVCQP